MRTKVNQDIKPILLEFKGDLEQLYQDRLVELILFGPYSRRKAKVDSDIDILVVLQNMESPYQELRKMSDVKYSFLEKYEKVISTVPTSLERYEKMEVPLYRVIKKEGIRI